MNEQPLLTERRDRILLITLNRPDARNAVNLAMAEAMAAALDELDATDELSVGVIAGEGKGFSSGMDLKAFATGERPWAGDRGFAGIVQKPAEKPLIAAIEGFAVAGGLEIALTGETITAERAAELGLVNRLADPGNALGAALELAGQVAENAPLALRATKTVMQQQWSWDEQTFWQE